MTLLEKAIEDKEGVIEDMKQLEGTIQELKVSDSAYTCSTCACMHSFGCITRIIRYYLK